MEKIILSKGNEMQISGINKVGGTLEISFQDGDFTGLEAVFLDKEALEKIVLTDESGKAMAAFKNYAILKRIFKDKDVIVDEINDTIADVVTVTLEQEPEWLVAQRIQDARIASVEETADTLVMETLGQIN